MGLKYIGLIRTLDLEYGAETGSAQGKVRNIKSIVLKLHNTLGGKYGSSFKGAYLTEIIGYRVEGRDYTDRPALLFSGVKELSNFDSWDIEKRVIIKQDSPLPMTLLSITPFMDKLGSILDDYHLGA